MSRIKTDLRPTVKRISTVTTTSPKKNDGCCKLPPVDSSTRSASASPRHSVDIKWSVDMVRGYTIPKETERSQAERRICSTKTPKTHHSNLDYEVRNVLCMCCVYTVKN